MNVLAVNGTFLAITVVGCLYLAGKYGNTVPMDNPPFVPTVVQAPVLPALASRGDIPATPDTYISNVYVHPRQEDLLPEEDESTQPYGWEFEEYAETIFKAHSLKPGLARTMLRLESQTGRLMVSSTGCEGWYQFCSKTAKHYGVEDPHDLRESTHGAAKLSRDNRRSLKIYKVPAINFHLYLAHMIGPKNTQTVYKAAVLKEPINRKTVKKAYKEIQSNWWTVSLGKQTGDYKKDFTTFYQYFKGKYKKVSVPTFEY